MIRGNTFIMPDGWTFDLKAAFLNQYTVDSGFRNDFTHGTIQRKVYICYRFSGLVDSMYRKARGLPTSGPPHAEIQKDWDTIPGFVAANGDAWIKEAQLQPAPAPPVPAPGTVFPNVPPAPPGTPVIQTQPPAGNFTTPATPPAAPPPPGGTSSQGFALGDLFANPWVLGGLGLGLFLLTMKGGK